MTTTVKNIEALTADVFLDILRDHWYGQDVRSGPDGKDSPGLRINAISATKVDQGVLSDVYRVRLEYSMPNQDTNNNVDGQEQQGAEPISSAPVPAPPTDWLVKFCRPDLGLSWMCRNETIFYGRLAPTLMQNHHRLPFAIPKFLNGSDQHIILEEVTNIETYPLTEGCPPEKIDFLLKSLAAWHAACWDSELLPPRSLPDAKGRSIERHTAATEIHGKQTLLVFPPGMGQRLHPLQKEGLFVASWRKFMDHLRPKLSLLRSDQQESPLDEGPFEFASDLCRRLSDRKLRDVHDLVHRHRVTCVHGDFHIANWLFPRTTAATTPNAKPVLVDFATVGYGNPLIDLVFFLVVSTNDDVASDPQLLLKEYYRLLIEYDPKISTKMTLSTLQEWFPWALLCQFMILVAYDGVCRDIAEAEEDEQKRRSQIQHFGNVNRRVILAIRSVDCWDRILSTLDCTTLEERLEAERFCQNTALTI